MRKISVRKLREILQKDTITLTEDICVKPYDSFVKNQLLKFTNLVNFERKAIVGDFDGTLDGNDFTLHIPLPLFNQVKSAGVIKNISIETTNKFHNPVVCELNYGILDNVTVNSGKNFENEDTINKAGLVYKNHGSIKNCKFKGDISNNTDIRSKKYILENIGSICSVNDGTIQNCVYEDGYINGVYSIGGIAGRNNCKIYNCEVRNCIINLNKKWSNGGGGIVGYNTDDSKISNCLCENTKIDSGIRIGGICGYNEGLLTESKSIQNTITGNEEIGGICGFSHGKSQVSNCISTSSINGNWAIGGIVGILEDGSCSSSISNSTVPESHKTGLIIGILKKSELKNCIHISDTEKELIGNNSEVENTDIYTKDITIEEAQLLVM